MKFGIDIGGTKTEFCVLNENHQVQFRERFLNKYTIEENLQCIYSLINKSGIRKIEKIGLSIKALVDPNKNIILKSSLDWLTNEFVNKIKTQYECEVKLQNDAKCFALAESQLGAGRPYKTGFYLILGTGIGGAVVFNNHIIDGLNNFAGEIGCLPYKKSTTYEKALSGPAFLKNYNIKFKCELNSPKEIMTEYRNKNKNALKYFNSYMRDLSSLLSNVIPIIAPEVIVIGGGLSNINEIIKSLPVYLYSLNKKQTPIICCNKLGDSAGVIGACLL